MKKSLSLCALWCCAVVCAQTAAGAWKSDCGDGTYVNPVLYSDYSDPDVCAVGDDYYLTASSFNCVPGLPVLHSRDLVNWQIVGHALPELLPRERFDLPQHGKGVWAPSIRHHDGSFYICWGDPDEGIFMVSCSDPSGEWTPPVCVVRGRGMIDPCPLWDSDGRCYLVNAWAASRAGFNSVLTLRELSADGTHALSQPRIVFDGGEVNHTAEGPKLYKRDGYYWILCPAGGVAMGWQLAMRSRSPYGPYEWRRVLWQGRTAVNGPHQGAWVHTPFGEDWFLHFSDKGAYGRVVYLQPVDWSSGWPVMGRDGEPLTRHRKPKAAAHDDHRVQTSDDFDGGMGLQWQWNANYNPLWGMPAPDGRFRLYTADMAAEAVSLWDVPNLLLQKPAAPRFTATASVCFASKEDGQYGGIVMMGRDYSALVVHRQGDHFVLEQRSCLAADEGNRETAYCVATLTPSRSDTIPWSPAIYLDIYLRLSVEDGTCRFAYSLDNRSYHDAGTPFAMKGGKWTGAKYGFVALCKDRKAVRGWLDIDWLHVSD